MGQRLPFPLLGIESHNGSELIGASTDAAARRRLPLPGLVATRRMIGVTWNRRTGMLSAALWIMNGTPLKPPFLFDATRGAVISQAGNPC